MVVGFYVINDRNSTSGGNLDTGNPMGKNSIIYGSYQGDDFTPGGGGARIPFMKHLPNALSYLKKGLRNVNDTMEHYNNLSGAFGSNSPMELDAMVRDSVFQNEITQYRENYIKNIIPKGWGQGKRIKKVNSQFLIFLIKP